MYGLVCDTASAEYMYVCIKDGVSVVPKAVKDVAFCVMIPVVSTCSI